MDTVPEKPQTEALDTSKQQEFFRDFEATDPFSQEKISTQVKYTLERGERYWSVVMYSGSFKIGELNVSVKRGERTITQVSKYLERRNLPYPFNEVKGIMTGAQEILNQQLKADGYTVIETTIPKERILSVLSRLRAQNPDGTYPLTTIQKDDEGNYRVRTDLNQQMSPEETAQITNELAKSI